jgi:hypothetical protein
MRVVLLAIQIAFTAAFAWGQDGLGTWVTKHSADILQTGAPVTRSIGSDGSLVLLPPVSSQNEINSEMVSLRPSVGVEFLRIVKAAPSASVGASAPATPFGAPATPFGALDWLRLFNTLHAASTMQGVTYFSVSRGKPEVLFVQSYAIASPASRQRISDPASTAIPLSSLFYTFQEDHSFGKNVYEETFTAPGDHIAVKIENLTTISLVLIPIIGPRSFVVRIVLVPVGRDLLFYGAAALRSGMPLGDRRSREESLINRLVAMTDWLGRELAAQKQP